MRGQEATAFKSVATLPREGHPRKWNIANPACRRICNFDCQFSEVRKELREIGPGESALRPGVVVLAGQSEGKLRGRLAIYEKTGRK
jgi:hypothetical protein